MPQSTGSAKHCYKFISLILTVNKYKPLCFAQYYKPSKRNVFFFFFFFFFLWPYQWPMEAPRLGVKSELQQPALATATAIPDASLLCKLHHSSRQLQILNPPSKARDWTYILIDTSWVHYSWATMGTPFFFFWPQMQHVEVPWG